MASTGVFRWAKSPWVAWCGAAVAAVLLANSYPHLSSTAQGDVRETPVHDQFLSGGARSEIVLKEIAETLKRIDQRLDRFEKALRESDAAEAARQQGGPAPTVGDGMDRPRPAGEANENR
jgi:hypothetical protein